MSCRNNDSDAFEDHIKSNVDYQDSMSRHHGASLPWNTRVHRSHLPPKAASNSSGSSASTSSSQSAALPNVIKNNFLKNKWSAKDAIEVAQAAQTDNCTTVGAFAKYKNGSNNARNMLKTCLKECTCPAPYYAMVRTKDPHSGEPLQVELPFLLPHEMLPYILSKADSEQLDAWRRHPARHADVQSFCREWNCDENLTYPIGFHGDGVPFQAKMTDSLEQFSWSFCADPGSTRYLFSAIPKSCLLGRETFEDMLTIFVQSLHVLATNTYPNKRLNGEDWSLPNDSARSRLHGPLGCNACLLELRGDWAYYNAVFAFPSWQSTRMCWKCCASHLGELSYLDPSVDAAWRFRRLSDEQFLELQRRTGITPSVIFSAPGCKLSYVKIDWLHTMDLGVCQTILGNVLWECLPFLNGDNQKDRMKSLWLLITEYYSTANPSTRFQKMTFEMIKLSGKGPKLRGKAAETRHLVPFVQQLAAAHAHRSKHCSAVNDLMQLLANLYQHIQTEPYPAQQAAADCVKMCEILLALHLEAVSLGRDKHWKRKPKLHLLQELLEYDCVQSQQSPKTFWTYLDERWGGEVAKIASRRGGKKTASLIAVSLIHRYRALL